MDDDGDRPGVTTTESAELREAKKRIRLLESPTGSGLPIPEFIKEANWDLSAILNAAKNVEMVNTNFPGANGMRGKFAIIIALSNGWRLWPRGRGP